MHRRTFLKLAGGALAATTTAGCADGRDAETRRRVSMTAGFGFSPRRLAVDAGTTVRWTNDSDVGHTVTAYADRIPADAGYFASGGFDIERAATDDVSGGLLAPGEGYDHAFAVAGTYEYYCIPHEGSGMVGTVVVE